MASYPRPTRLGSLLIFILLLWTSELASAQKKCYRMDGTESSDHSPCFPDAEHSACCLTNHTDPSKREICLGSGLCLATNNLIYENGCTDPTWKSSACPDVCPDKRNNWDAPAETSVWKPGQEREYWQVQTCFAGKVCCRASGDSGSCCTKSLLKDMAIGTPVYPGYTLMPVSTGVTTGTYAATPTGGRACASVEEGDCQAKQVTVGAAVGASLGAALIATLAALMFILRRQRKLMGTLESSNMAQAQAQAQAWSQMQMHMQQAGPGPGTTTTGTVGTRSPHLSMSVVSSRPPVELENRKYEVVTPELASS